MLDNHVKELQKNYSKIIAQSWCDPTFRKNFIENPIPILKKHGFDIPENAEVKIIEEDTPSKSPYHFNLPKAPEDLNCSVEEGPLVDASHSNCCCCCC